MLYLIDPETLSDRKCDAYCRFVVKPLYGVIIWPWP
jgi:hypothetical protein